MHLTPEELIDLADGARAEAGAPHLQSCEVCRHQVAALRKVLSTVAHAPGSPGGPGVDVPEPSPLFWDHLSQRVRDAVAAEGTPAAQFAGRRAALPGSWRAWATAGVAATLAIAIYVRAPHTLTPPSGARDGAAATSAAARAVGAAGARLSIGAAEAWFEFVDSCVPSKARTT